MTPSVRVRLQVDERRERLLDLGRRLFSEQAFDATSVDDIAARAGISKGLLYHYFRNKREFYLATLGEALREMIERTRPDPDLPPLARLDACIEAWLVYVEQNGALYAAVMRGGVGKDPEIEALVEGYRATVSGWVTGAIGIPEPRPALRTAMRGWLGFGEGASLEWVASGGALPRESVKSLLVRALGAAIEGAAALDPEQGIGPRPEA